MSKLQELINELCPDGVEYKKVGDVTFYEQPTKYIVKSTNYNDNFNTPVLTAGQSFILGYTNETDGIFEATKQEPIIIFDDFTGAFKWVDFSFKVKSSAMKLITSNEDVMLLRYLYHVMGVIGFTSTEHKRLWLSKYSEIKIPVPPLPVQEEIVRILDKMTDYVTELKAELKARKMQYEYYRDDLLAFGSSAPKGKIQELINELCPDGVEYETLKDVCKFQNGFSFKSGLFKKTGMPILRITNINNGLIEENGAVYFNPSDYANLDNYKVKGGDVVVAMSGATTGKIGINQTGKTFYLNQRVGLFKPGKTLNNKYLYHWLRGQETEIFNASSGGAQPNLSTKAIMDFILPVPPLLVQEEIVKILDKFSLICNDISAGLPAEIEARQKQYEYYRDKLLSFQKLENEEC